MLKWLDCMDAVFVVHNNDNGFLSQLVLIDHRKKKNETKELTKKQKHYS